MTTTNMYQGLNTEKSTSRVSQAPGGTSNIFGHYQEENQREQVKKHQEDTDAVMQSMNRAAEAGGDAQNSYLGNRDSFAANRQRNQGDTAPFATSDSLISTSNIDRPAHHQQVVGADFETPQQRQAANRMRNLGTQAPFAVGDGEQPRQHADGAASHQQTIGADYQTPKQRQADNPNKAANSFSNLFGDTESQYPNAAKAKGKVSTHNPVTWEAYSNFDSSKDQPQHRSRFENFASTKAGTVNPITGEERNGNVHTSTRVYAPPGGKSSIQF